MINYQSGRDPATSCLLEVSPTSHISASLAKSHHRHIGSEIRGVLKNNHCHVQHRTRCCWSIHKQQAPQKQKQDTMKLGGRRAAADDDAVAFNLDAVTFGGRKEKSRVVTNAPKRVTAVPSGQNQSRKNNVAARDSSKEKKKSTATAVDRGATSSRRQHRGASQRLAKGAAKSPDRRVSDENHSESKRSRSRSATSHRSSSKRSNSVDKRSDRNSKKSSSTSNSKSVHRRQSNSLSPTRKSSAMTEPSRPKSRDTSFGPKIRGPRGDQEQGHRRRSKSPTSKPSMDLARRGVSEVLIAKEQRQSSSQSKSQSRSPRSRSPSSKKSLASKPTADKDETKPKKMHHRKPGSTTRSTSKSEKKKGQKPVSVAHPPRTIDRVPTAMGYNSDDSVEALLEERSRYSRYSIDEQRVEPIFQNTEDDEEAVESLMDDKYSSHSNYGHVESLWSESTDDAPRWSDERDDKATRDPRIKKVVHDIAVSYSVGDVTGDMTYPSVMDVESEWSKSIVLENDSESVNADPIYTKPVKTRKSQRSVGSRTKKYDLKAQVDAQKKLKKEKLKTQERAQRSDEDLNTRPDNTQAFQTPNELEPFRTTIPATIDGKFEPTTDIISKTDKETASGAIESLTQDEGKAMPKPSDSGDAQQESVGSSSPSMATFFIRGLASITRAANVAHAPSPLPQIEEFKAGDDHLQDHEVQETTPTKIVPPAPEVPEPMLRNLDAQRDVDAILGDSASPMENPIAHVHTAAEDEVEMAWNDSAIQTKTMSTDYSNAEDSELVESSDEDDSDDDSSSDDEPNVPRSNEARKVIADVNTTVTETAVPQRVDESSREPRSQGIILRALKAFRKSQSDIPNKVEGVDTTHENSRRRTNKTTKEDGDSMGERKTPLHHAKKYSNARHDAMKNSTVGNAASEDNRGNKNDSSKRVRNHFVSEAVEKPAVRGTESKFDDTTKQKTRTSNTKKTAANASKKVKNQPTLREKTETLDVIEGNRSLISVATMESADPIVLQRSQVTKATVSTTSKKSKRSKKMKLPHMSRSTSTKSGPPSVQLSEGEKLTMYSKSLMTEDSEESADQKHFKRNLPRLNTPRLRKNLQKKLAAEMTQLDEYEHRQATPIDEPQLVQCLKYYYCGAAATAAGTAITTVDCTPKAYRTHDGAVDDMIMEQRMDDDDDGEHPEQSRRSTRSLNEIREDDVLKVETSESLDEAPEIALPRTPSVVMEVTGMKLHLDDDSEANRRDVAVIRAHEKADGDALSITSIEFTISASSGVMSSKSGAESVISYESGDDDDESVQDWTPKTKKKSFLRGFLKRIGRKA